MRKPIFGLLSVLGLMLLLGVTSTVAFADYKTGLKAFEAEDFSKAFRHWQKSADEGDARAQLGLARLYRDGKGTVEDKIVAVLYFTLAAKQKVKSADQDKQELVKNFSVEELHLAQKLISSWEISGDVVGNFPEEESENLAEESNDSGEILEPTVEEKANIRWFRAAEKGNVKVIEEMLEAGFGLNKQDSDGWTALMLAALNKRRVTSTKLIKSGADLNHSDPLGMTALMAASVAGSKRLVEFMVKSGADIDQVDTVGETAEYMAEQAGYVNIARYLATLELPADQVKKAQQFLIVLGYLKGSADGKTGPKTSAAVKEFQKDSSQKQTGLVRKLLLNTLESKMVIVPAKDAEKIQTNFESVETVSE